MSEQDFQDQHDTEVEAALHAEDVDPETAVDAPAGGVPDPDDVELDDVEEREREEAEDDPATYDEEE
jgi:hypothetical protein